METYVLAEPFGHGPSLSQKYPDIDSDEKRDEQLVDSKFCEEWLAPNIE
jgi:hypothetical protein